MTAERRGPSGGWWLDPHAQEQKQNLESETGELGVVDKVNREKGKWNKPGVLHLCVTGVWLRGARSGGSLFSSCYFQDHWK